MDIKDFFKMQDAVDKYMKTDISAHPNLKLSNARDIILHAIRELSEESARDVVHAALVERFKDKT